MSCAGGPQLHHYRQCLLNYGARHRYMAFIDNDEVLKCRPLQHDPLAIDVAS